MIRRSSVEWIGLYFLALSVLAIVTVPRPAAQTGASHSSGETELRTGAPSVRGGVDPGNGNHASSSSEDGPSRPSMTGGVPTPHPSVKLGDWSCSDPPLCGETPQPRIVDGISGTASWYRYIPGGAAAGPALRRFLGPHWRGGIVRVCAGETCVVAALSDFCRCDTGAEKLIDLDLGLFVALAPPGRDANGDPRLPGWQGTLDVTVVAIQ